MIWWLILASVSALGIILALFKIARELGRIATELYIGNDKP